MDSEFTTLLHYGTWELVLATLNMNIIGCRWVYHIKRRPDGSIDRYKERLVTEGYHQQDGIDFLDTFSPMVKPTTNQLVLAHALSFGWTIQLLDIQNIFPHGFLIEEVYMQQPQGHQ
ncbi:hypothetical protein F2P56_008735 [Juglans regia]|uniref:Reverse transcriptase Ty1/copia-type domain-containing protein n=1 Tax=Juglans regia TaxID=51240 RepID=A0A833XVP4_JUGRE|nr:hypothetical protein F2P56_008735 [Juglans regia]